jgi:hypothetical protein
MRCVEGRCRGVTWAGAGIAWRLCERGISNCTNTASYARAGPCNVPRKAPRAFSKGGGKTPIALGVYVIAARRADTCRYHIGSGGWAFFKCYLPFAMHPLATCHRGAAQNTKGLRQFPWSSLPELQPEGAGLPISADPPAVPSGSVSGSVSGLYRGLYWGLSRGLYRGCYRSPIGAVSQSHWGCVSGPVSGSVSQLQVQLHRATSVTYAAGLLLEAAGLQLKFISTQPTPLPTTPTPDGAT